MEKKYVCPVCQKEANGLEELNSCIAKHVSDKKAKDEHARLVRIEALQTENEMLNQKLDKNCKELEKLGVSTARFYKRIPPLRNIEFVEKEKDETLTKEDYDNIFKDFNSFLSALIDPLS